MEQASLQQALGQKETAEQGLAAELESLRQQLERATQQQAELREENSVLCTQQEALAAEAGEREAGKKCWFRGWRRPGRGGSVLARARRGPWEEGRGPDRGAGATPSALLLRWRGSWPWWPLGFWEQCEAGTASGKWGH